MSKAIHFWEKSVGVEIVPHIAEGGACYWQFRFVRARKADGGYCIDYGGDFTRNNIEALGKVMAKVIDFIDRENAVGYAQRPRPSKAA